MQDIVSWTYVQTRISLQQAVGIKISNLHLNVDPFFVTCYLMSCSWRGEDIMVRKRESIDIFISVQTFEI